jgi:hypothetical protein
MASEEGTAKNSTSLEGLRLIALEGSESSSGVVGVAEAEVDADGNSGEAQSRTKSSFERPFSDISRRAAA